MNYSATDMSPSHKLYGADHDNDDDDDDSSRSWQTMAFDRVTLVKQYRIHHPRIYHVYGSYQPLKYGWPIIALRTLYGISMLDGYCPAAPPHQQLWSSAGTIRRRIASD